MSEKKLPNKISTKKTDEERIRALHSIYNITYKDKALKSIKIERSSIRRLLEENHFYWHHIDKDNAAVIRIVDGKVELYNNMAVKSFVKNYIANLPKYTFKKDFGNNDAPDVQPITVTADMVNDAFTNFSENLIDTNLSNLQETKNLHFLQDTRYIKYLFFRNKIVEITKAGIKLLDYSDKYNIWVDQIIDHDIKLDESPGTFIDFINKITGDDDDRLRSLKTIIGYLLHYNFDTDLKAVYLADVNNDFEQRSGRTGKGLLGKAISHIVNREKSSTTYVAIPGAMFAALKMKRYMSCEINTQIVHIEDAEEKTDVSPKKLVSDITEGISILKHYGSPHTHFVKLMVSTNYAMDFTDETYRGRTILFELQNFFNAKNTPFVVYNCRFFSDDWYSDKFPNEWDKFYTFMINCCSAYMREGLIEAGSINYENRVIYETTSEVFVIWLMEEIIEKRCKNAQGEDVEYEVASTFLYEQYTASPERYTALVSTTKQPVIEFAKWIKKLCAYKSIPFGRYQSGATYYVFNPSKEKWALINKQKNYLKNK